MQTAPLIPILVGLVASILVGLIKSMFTAVDAWPGLAKQGLVLALAVAMIVGLNFFDIGSIPEIYQSAVGQVVQAIVAALTGIGAHSVKNETKDAMKGDS